MAMQHTPPKARNDKILKPATLSANDLTQSERKRKLIEEMNDDNEEESNKTSNKMKTTEMLIKKLDGFEYQIKTLNDTINLLNNTISELKEENKQLKETLKKIGNKQNEKKAAKSPTTYANMLHSNDMKVTHTHTNSKQNNSGDDTNRGETSRNGNNASAGSSGSNNNTANDNTHTYNDNLDSSLISMNSDDSCETPRRKKINNQSPVQKKTGQKTQNVILTNTNNNDESKYKQNDKIKRNDLIPPIVIWNENIAATQTLIKQNITKNGCIFESINKTKVRVIPKDIKIREQIINFLKERQYTFNTYTPADKKMTSILLKGCETNEEEIIQETLNENDIIPYKIKKFTTGHMRANNIESNIWQIILKPETDVNQILKIRYVDHWSVKWEFIKNVQWFNAKNANDLTIQRPTAI